MTSRVVPLRLDHEILKLIDMLVELGVFSSRSEALRELVEAGLSGYKGLISVARAVEKLFELERREGDIPVRLPGALKQLLEEREASHELYRHQRHSRSPRPPRP